MSEHSLHWDARLLQEQLEPVLPGLSVEVRERSVSTNTALLERSRVESDVEAPETSLAMVRRSVESAAFGRRPAAGLPCLLVAEQQSGGRGRQGRAWHSAPGASLTFSLALPLQPSDWSGLSLAVGVAVADALDPDDETPSRQAGIGVNRTGRTRIGLKWPNDLWLMDGHGAGRKLGGILIETVSASGARLAVIGIGLNIRTMDVADASSGFACLQELDDAISAPAALHKVALPLALALRRFEQEGFSAFADRFAARDLLLGRLVSTTQADVAEGIAEGVSAQGALRVRTASGVKTVHSGDVSVRLNPVPEPTGVRAPC